MFLLILDSAILETQLEGWKPDERKNWKKFKGISFDFSSRIMRSWNCKPTVKGYKLKEIK